MQCLDREQGIVWVVKERLPFFLHSDHYSEYRYFRQEGFLFYLSRDEYIQCKKTNFMHWFFSSSLMYGQYMWTFAHLIIWSYFLSLHQMAIRESANHLEGCVVLVALKLSMCFFLLFLRLAKLFHHERNLCIQRRKCSSVGTSVQSAPPLYSSSLPVIETDMMKAETCSQNPEETFIKQGILAMIS